VGVATAVVQGGAIRPIVSKLGERNTALMGLLCGVVSFSGFGLATAGWMIYAAIVVNSLWSLYSPAATALMTKRVDADAQGRLQGALAGMHAITAVVAPAIFPLTFAWAIAPGAPWPQPGAPFLLAAGLLGLALLMAARVTRET
jgi:DHA1 family tetracycline resistance protein-like MFS transporter